MWLEALNSITSHVAVMQWYMGGGLECLKKIACCIDNGKQTRSTAADF